MSTRMTKSERVIRYLKALGFRFAKTRSRKYIRLTDGRNRDYWVGRKGGVRVGQKLSDSISITRALHAAMARWEQKSVKEVK